VVATSHYDCEGADLNIANDEGQRAMHYAASNGHLDTMLQLYELGADPEAKNNYKETAIHLASAEGNNKRARVLCCFFCIESP
jgi:ankyrin repeat protein